jgi:hypothetical protein
MKLKVSLAGKTWTHLGDGVVTLGKHARQIGRRRETHAEQAHALLRGVPQGPRPRLPVRALLANGA